MQQRRRNGWWNSLSFEADFKRRQLGRALAVTIAYVAVSSVAVVYARFLRPLALGQLPFYPRAEPWRSGR
jgi:hypothetical protein